MNKLKAHILESVQHLPENELHSLIIGLIGILSYDQFDLCESAKVGLDMGVSEGGDFNGEMQFSFDFLDNTIFKGKL
jgi:hypothetical protein